MFRRSCLALMACFDKPVDVVVDVRPPEPFEQACSCREDTLMPELVVSLFQ